MEVILSSAFGLKADSQTNPDDKITQMAKKVMDSSFLPIIVMMIPVIGKYLSTEIAKSSRFGFGWTPLVKVAKGIIKKRRESSKNAEQRKVSPLLRSRSSNTPKVCSKFRKVIPKSSTHFPDHFISPNFVESMNFIVMLLSSFVFMYSLVLK